MQQTAYLTKLLVRLKDIYKIMVLKGTFLKKKSIFLFYK